MTVNNNKINRRRRRNDERMKEKDDLALTKKSTNYLTRWVILSYLGYQQPWKGSKKGEKQCVDYFYVTSVSHTFQSMTHDQKITQKYK